MIETILTNLVVLAAALFLARWLYRNLVSRDKGATCDSCESCESSEGDQDVSPPFPGV